MKGKRERLRSTSRSSGPGREKNGGETEGRRTRVPTRKIFYCRRRNNKGESTANSYYAGCRTWRITVPNVTALLFEIYSRRRDTCAQWCATRKQESNSSSSFFFRFRFIFIPNYHQTFSRRVATSRFLPSFLLSFFLPSLDSKVSIEGRGKDRLLCPPTATSFE